MQYEKVARFDELNDGEKQKITLNGKVLLLTKIDGACYAIDNRCPHMGGSLYDGTLDGASIACPRHGTSFDVRTGKVVSNGKLAFIKLNVHDVNTYPVKIEDGDILVGLE